MYRSVQIMENQLKRCYRQRGGRFPVVLSGMATPLIFCLYSCIRLCDKIPMPGFSYFPLSDYVLFVHRKDRRLHDLKLVVLVERMAFPRNRNFGENDGSMVFKLVRNLGVLLIFKVFAYVFLKKVLDYFRNLVLRHYAKQEKNKAAAAIPPPDEEERNEKMTDEKLEGLSKSSGESEFMKKYKAYLEGQRRRQSQYKEEFSKMVERTREEYKRKATEKNENKKKV